MSKSHSLWGYVGKITVNPRLELVKTVLLWEASTWELVSQSSCSFTDNKKGICGGL